MLNEIHMSDLYRNNEIEITQLSLSDYDWVEHDLKAQFMLNDFTLMSVHFNFCGVIASEMEVSVSKHSMSFKDAEKYKYHYDSDIFIKHLRRFMLKHIAAWDEKYCFDGMEYILDFYNDVLKNGTLKE